jgi:hypothetical protein
VIITLVFEKNANFFTENWQKSQKIVIITLVFEKNANFFTENWQKSQKIGIITSTPGHPDVNKLAGNPCRLGFKKAQKV